VLELGKMFLDDKVVDYGFWEPEPLPAIPARSRLYSLAPIGRGTSQIISLTSHMSRLADAHNLSVGSMFNWDPMSVAASRFPQRLIRYSGGMKKKNAIGDGAHDLNGLSSRAEEWVKVLEQVTLVRDLHELTMLPFRQLFGGRGLLRTRRAWCPECYESDREAGTLYDRLIWCLCIVSRCPIHHTGLIEECPFCGKTESHLAANNLSGYCSSCESWLGSSKTEREDAGEEDEFERYVSATVADLIQSVQTGTSKRPDCEAIYSRRLFSANLKECIRHLSGGVVRAFSEAINVEYQTLHGWLEKGPRLSLEGFLKLSFALGKTAHSVLLSPEVSESGIEEMWTFSAARFQRLKERRSTSATRDALQRELRCAECRSLQSVAESLGYSSTSTLYRAAPGLCRQVSDRYREQNRASSNYQRPNERKCSDGEIESAVNDALLEEIPPRPKDVALRLGYSSDHAIRYRFPDLIQKVIQRRNQWEKSKRKIRRKVLRAAISEIPPPSVYELSARHGPGFSKFLLNQEVDLVKKLGDAIKSFEQTLKDEIRRILVASLNEDPAPTMRVVGDRLGFRVERIRKLYPDIVAEITARSRDYRSEQFRKKQQALEQDVLQFSSQLNETGIPPRYDCIIPLLSADSLYKWDDLSRAIQKARHALGLEPAKSGPAPEREKKSERVGCGGRKRLQKAGK